ncbi:MAG: VOC family protein [Clostridiaceae bacterium]|nr:VOC family protein [Clostridiaceae bacterium]
MNTVIPGLGFHHIALRASDFDRSVAFYRDALGCKVVAAWGDSPRRVAMLDLGDDGRVEIFESPYCGKRIAADFLGEWFHFAMRTADADLAYNRALEAGAVSVTPPKDVDIQSNPVMPVRIAFVNGPDGEVIEFFQLR